MRSRIAHCTLLAALLVARLTPSEAADDQATHKMADYVICSFNAGALNFKRIFTGDPVIDDGSIAYAGIEGVTTIASVDRGPGRLTITCQPNLPKHDVLELTEPQHVLLNGWVSAGPETFHVIYTQTLDGGRVLATLEVGNDREIIVPPIKDESAADFLKKHPDLAATYLVPLMEKLDLGCLYVKPGDAEGAFAAHLPVDPQAAKSVAALLPRLDDDSPAIRSAASKELEALGPRAVPVLKGIDPEKLPLQTRVALRDFLRPYSGLDDPRLKDPVFLTLCLAVDDADIPPLAKAQLEKLNGKPLDFNASASLMDRRVAVIKLLAETAPKRP